MATFTKPLQAKSGPDKTKELFNDHADRIEELQDAVAEIDVGAHGMNGEDTDFYAIKDAKLVKYIIKATQVEALSEEFEQ